MSWIGQNFTIVVHSDVCTCAKVCVTTCNGSFVAVLKVVAVALLLNIS